MQAIRPTAAGAHYSRIFTHTLGQVNVQNEDLLENKKGPIAWAP